MSTRQTDLLDEVLEKIEAFIVENPLTEDPPVKIAFDPHRKMEDETFRIFVIPDVYEMNIGGSLKRSKVIALHKTIYITVSFSKKFVGIDDDDIAPWDEVKELMDYREDLCIYLCQQQYTDAELREAELNIIDDPEKNNRQFLSFLTMGFQTSACN
jgi:hypothetical protein